MGWFFLFISIIYFLLKRIKQKNNGKTISEKIAICLISAYLLIAITILFLFSTSDAFRFSKNYITTNKDLVEQIGKINTIIALPRGSYFSTNNQVEVNLCVIAKGSKKFKDLNVQLFKNDTSDWVILNTY
ncbi:MAG: hypothetical protein K1X55_14905 [Chitinophagales bacterium]|nr:hypothetical protein [Chitinophagales bacterium]